MGQISYGGRNGFLRWRELILTVVGINSYGGGNKLLPWSECIAVVIVKTIYRDSRDSVAAFFVENMVLLIVGCRGDFEV